MDCSVLAIYFDLIILNGVVCLEYYSMHNVLRFIHITLLINIPYIYIA